MSAPPQTSYINLKKLFNFYEPPGQARMPHIWEGLTQPISISGGTASWGNLTRGCGTEVPHGKARAAPWWSQSMGQPEAPIGGFSQTSLISSFCFSPLPCLTLSTPIPTQRVNVEKILPPLNCKKLVVWGAKGGHHLLEFGVRAGMGNWPEYKTILSQHTLN